MDRKRRTKVKSAKTTESSYGGSEIFGKGKDKHRDESEKECEACDLVLCEDPETGEIVVRPKGKCPEDYIEKTMKKLEKQPHLPFVFPKRIFKREDDDDQEEFEDEDEGGEGEYKDD